MPLEMKYQIETKHRLIGYTRKNKTPANHCGIFPFRISTFPTLQYLAELLAFGQWSKYRANSSASRINNFGHDNTYLQKTGRGENHIIEVTPLRLAKRDIQLVTLQMYIYICSVTN